MLGTPFPTPPAKHRTLVDPHSRPRLPEQLTTARTGRHPTRSADPNQTPADTTPSTAYLSDAVKSQHRGAPVLGHVPCRRLSDTRTTVAQPTESPPKLDPRQDGRLRHADSRRALPTMVNPPRRSTGQKPVLVTAPDERRRSPNITRTHPKGSKAGDPNACFGTHRTSAGDVRRIVDESTHNRARQPTRLATTRFNAERFVISAAPGNPSICRDHPERGFPITESIVQCLEWNSNPTTASSMRVLPSYRLQTFHRAAQCVNGM